LHRCDDRVRPWIQLGQQNRHPLAAARKNVTAAFAVVMRHRIALTTATGVCLFKSSRSCSVRLSIPELGFWCCAGGMRVNEMKCPPAASAAIGKGSQHPATNKEPRPRVLVGEYHPLAHRRASHSARSRENRNRALQLRLPPGRELRTVIAKRKLRGRSVTLAGAILHPNNSELCQCNIGTTAALR